MPCPKLAPTRAPSPSVEPIARPRVSLGVVVAIACGAQFMVILDTSIVNVALPAMKAGLGLSSTDEQWVVDGYLITFGGFLLLAARTGDLFGRRSVLQAGLVVFTAASLAGGLAQDAGLLLGARVAQGIGAAALAPASLSLITASHPEGDLRHRALSIWAAVGAAAGPVGMVLGGVLTSALSWRCVMFVNVPIGIALLVATTVTLLPTPRASRRGHLDIPGALTVTVAVGLIVYGVSQATTAGWGSTTVIASLTAAVALLAAFVMIEHRSPSPLVPLGVLAHRKLTTANALMACLGVCFTSSLFFVSLYLQQVLGYSPVRTGLALLPMGVFIVIGALASKRLILLVGPTALLVAGAVTGAIGLAWLSRLPVHSDYVVHILGPTLLAAAGFSIMMFPITLAGTSGLEARLAGLASGLLNVGRQLGGAIGLAILVTIADTATRHSHHSSQAAATVHGYRSALFICAAVSLASTLIALAMPKTAPSVAAATATPTARTRGRLTAHIAQQTPATTGETP